MKRWKVYYESRETTKGTFEVWASDFEAAFTSAMASKNGVGTNVKLRGIYFCKS